MHCLCGAPKCSKRHGSRSAYKPRGRIESTQGRFVRASLLPSQHKPAQPAHEPLPAQQPRQPVASAIPSCRRTTTPRTRSQRSQVARPPQGDTTRRHHKARSGGPNAKPIRRTRADPDPDPDRGRIWSLHSPSGPAYACNHRGYESSALVMSPVGRRAGPCAGTRCAGVGRQAPLPRQAPAAAPSVTMFPPRFLHCHHKRVYRWAPGFHGMRICAVFVVGYAHMR